jgi:hypothetical protein
MLWTAFVVCYGIRSGIVIAGSHYFTGEFACHLEYSFIRLTFTYGESVFYSPTSNQCLTSGLRAMQDPAYGITAVVAPMVFDILLLTLTFTKAFKSAPLGSHHRSPVVCVYSIAVCP